MFNVVFHEKERFEDEEENEGKDITVEQPKKKTKPQKTKESDADDEVADCTIEGPTEEPDSTIKQQNDDNDEAEETSEDSSDDEQSDTFGDDEFPGINQSECPSADVFYQDSTSSQEIKATTQFKEELTPVYVSGIAAESIMWLAPRLGPVLTSRYLTKQLLTMLPQCYMDVVGVEEFEYEDEDRKAKWVLYCLGNFCALYGEAFVLHQYLPYAEKIVSTT